MPEPGAARLTPHCQIVRLNFLAEISPLPVFAAPAFIVTLRSLQALQKLPPFKYFRNATGFFKLQPCLLRRRHRLPRLSLLSKSGCCGSDWGRIEQQFAGGAGNEASCFLLGCTVGSHDTDWLGVEACRKNKKVFDRSRWRCFQAFWQIFTSPDVGIASCLIVCPKQSYLA